jgi:hypothetical protein
MYLQIFARSFDVIHSHVFNCTPIEDVTVRRLLRRELYEFLKAREDGIERDRPQVDRGEVPH